MLAWLLSRYQLVFVYIYVSLYHMLAGLLSISVSVVRVCLCLSLSKDLLNSSPLSKPLLCLCIIMSLIFCSNFFIMHKCQIYCQCLLLIMSRNARMSMSNFLGLCCEGMCDRQTMVLLCRYPLSIIIVFLIISYETVPFSKLFCVNIF